MDNSLLVSISHQLASQRAMDVIANNLANVSTAGFKRENAKFEEYVAQMRPTEDQMGQQPVSFVKDAGILRDNGQGPVEHTGAPFDLAISGKGYFAVQTPNGIRYTRDGHFSLNQAGQVVTSDGYALQGEGGAVTVNPDDGDIEIGGDGTVSSVKNGAANQIGKLRIQDFADERGLKKEGRNLYNTNQAPIAPDHTSVVQGSLEGSNVQPVVEISHMIEVMRAYEATATLTKGHEDMLRDAIDKLGQMPS